MDNEYNMVEETPSYWNSVLIAGVITGLITAVMGLVSGYLTISNPTAGSITGMLVCLLGAVGGIIVNWHYAKENDLTYKIGKGALLGFLTAIVAVVISALISQIWTMVIDPGLNQAIYDASISSLEAQGMTQDQIDMAMQFQPEPGTTTYLLVQVGMGFLSLGIINAITGLIGAKIFASED